VWRKAVRARNPEKTLANRIIECSLTTALKGLSHAQELLRIACHMLLQHIAAQRVPDRPIEDHLGGIREMSLAVRIIRLVHQLTRPEDVEKKKR
jgi:hypothetical protein